MRQRRREIRVVGQFDAQDGHGNPHVIIVRDVFIETIPLHGSRSWIAARNFRYSLEDGTVLNQIDADTFQVVQTNEIIRKL
jgi:hypothetical protein